MAGTWRVVPLVHIKAFPFLLLFLISTDGGAVQVVELFTRIPAKNKRCGGTTPATTPRGLW